MNAPTSVCRFETRVARVIQETPRDRSFVLPVPANAQEAFRFVPGQFIVVQDPEAAQPRRKAYSISSEPQRLDAVEVTVRDMGTFGHAFYDFPVGKALRIEGPRGRFVLDGSTQDMVLLAGGSGVTPFRSFVRHLQTTGTSRNVVLFQSARRPQDLIFHDEFAARAQADPRFTYRPTVTRPEPGDDWQGATGRVEVSRVAPVLTRPEATQWYVCGPAAFVSAALAMGEALGVPASHRHKEQWG